MRGRMFLFLVLVFFACGAFGQEDTRKPVVSRSRTTAFYNHDCEKTETCSLKRVEFTVERYRMWVLGGYYHSVRLLALYETDSVDTLEDYTFVQFFRGCRYDSELIDGEVQKTLVVRWHEKTPTTFLFPRWTVDTYNQHPDFCAGLEGTPRHFLCRWKENMRDDLFSANGAKFYGLEKPIVPVLYVTDRQSGAFVIRAEERATSSVPFTADLARNNSLRMRTCLYRTADVPRRISSMSETEFAEPLYCFDWQNSFVYNHVTQEFEELTEVIPECAAASEKKE